MDYNDCVMPKVTIRRGQDEYVVSDVTFEQVKELVGVNGYASHAPKQTPMAIASIPQRLPLRDDYDGFVKAISDRGRVFIKTLQHHPEGIEANALAGKLGYQDARQIGGLTGGGLAKIGKRHGVKMKDVYRAETTFPGGKRTVTFYPCKFVSTVNEEKSAV